MRGVGDRRIAPPAVPSPRAELAVVALLGLAALAAVGFVVEYALDANTQLLGLALGLEPDELAVLVRAIRELESMLASPVDKDDVAPYDELKRVFEKSVVALRDIAPGAVIEPDMLGVKKPGTGIPARRRAEVVGRRARVPIAADSVLREGDVDWSGA